MTDIVHFNSGFSRWPILTLGCGRNKEQAHNKIKELLKQSPLFIHDCGNEDWHSDHHPHIFEDGGALLRLPFPSLRASLTNRWPEHPGKAIIDVFITRDAIRGIPATYGLAKFREYLHPVEHGSPLKSLLITFVNANCKPPWQFVPYDALTGKPIDDPRVCGISMVELQGLCDLVKEVVTKFIVDWFNPSFHPLKVSPQHGRNKSVEWHEAREHYVLVHKRMASRASQNGALRSISQIMAHCRRAHLRLLSSPRYKKRGERIFVRSTWVGPKEWLDCSGTKYSIMENWGELARTTDKKHS